MGRNFVFFGFVFRPQDIYLFVLGLLTFLVFVVLFTAVFGRLFCGWICPQTVFMEMVFRKIEYWIDGSPHQQRKLREGPWSGKKIFKWVVKQSIFFGISFVICNVFLAYIIGVDALFDIVTDPPSEHLGGLTGMIIFTFLFYGVFSWFREQACTIVCPYGRLQGVLIDPNSIVVAYDYGRGEPRGRLKKGEDRTDKGDCVVCKACVSVCPTGIDIRNGTQLECVNCTACIDACNAIMRKVKLPEGLIRYTSENRLQGIRGFKVSGRVFVYAIALAVSVTLLSYLMLTRTDVQTTILRTPGTLYYETDQTIRNLYSVKLINKTFDQIDIEFRLKAPEGGSLSTVSGNVSVAPEGFVETALFVDIPKEQLYAVSTTVLIEVVRDGEVIDEIKTNFMGPGPGGKR
jgi:cytochrome c oxidase accessory protein FixG